MALRLIFLGVDLNVAAGYGDAPEYRHPGDRHERRQDAVRPAHGFSAVEHFRADCCALRRRRSGANAVLCRAIPGDGVRATDLPREPARHRSLPVGASAKLYHMGFREPVRAIDAGRCQRDARLAHLRRVRPAADCPSEEALCQRKPWAWSWTTRSMPWTPPPSTCACRCFHGRTFARTKAAVKMHTLLDLRGNIPSFIHISRRQAARRERPRSAAARSRAPSTSWIAATSTSRACTCCIRLAPSSSPAPSRTWMRTASTRRRPIAATGIICDQTIALDGLRLQQGLSRSSAPHPLQGRPTRARRWCF